MKIKRLAEVIDQKRQSDGKARRRAFYDNCRRVLDGVNTETMCWSIVAWDGTGNMKTGMLCDVGAISEALAPTLVRDALNRHVSVMMAARKLSS